MIRSQTRTPHWILVHSTWVIAGSMLTLGCGSNSSEYAQTNLVADTAGAAAHVDPAMLNAWGIASSPTGPFWINDNHSGVSTVYDGNGTRFPAASPLVVTVPLPLRAAGNSSPTGMVYNPTRNFVVSGASGSAAASFIFATEDGTISAWSSQVSDNNAALQVNNSGASAIYKGLALGSNASGDFLYATDFHNGKVDVFDGQFRAVNLAGSFADVNLPAGFAPFGIQAIGSEVYVSYAKQDADAHDDEGGPGNGYINVFDTSGNFVQRLASQGNLNSPWGMVIAPNSFGDFGGALLVGNFGDGRINAYDPGTGTFLGQLNNTDGGVLTIPGLWGLAFGNGGTAGPLDTLFFTAGPDGELHGLFGSLTAQ